MSAGEQTRRPAQTTAPACDVEAAAPVKSMEGSRPAAGSSQLTEFLAQLAEVIATTLELPTLLRQTAELVQTVLPYRIFAIFLMNDRTGDLRMRFQTGHALESERVRLRVGQGIVGKVAETRQASLVNDVARSADYIEVNPQVCSELAVPLIAKGRLIGVIDIESEQLNYFKPEHLNLLTLTGSRIAQAIENARLYTRVARQARTLRVLNEIAGEFTSILDLPVLFERLGQLLHRLLDFQFFTVWIADRGAGVLESRFSTRFGEVMQQTDRLALDGGLVGAAMASGELAHAADVRRDSRYQMRNRETRSELVVPLVYKNETIGVLDFEHTRPHYFSEEHERALVTLASQIAVSIENARLYQQLAAQEQRLEHDLSMARDVQLRLLPQEAPRHEHATLAARFLPARQIGGDLYDFLRYDADRSAIAIGDVSGKAAPAALYAALVSGIMRSAGAGKPGPAEMLKLLNDSLQERHVSAQYVTMVYAVWNDANMTLQIANAGAQQPVFYRARGSGGTVDVVKAEGFPLGLFPDVEYEEISLAARPGDALVFMSDGITDAQNEAGEMFGTERVMKLVRAHPQASARWLGELILAAVGEFQGGADRFDDETVVVLRVR